MNTYIDWESVLSLIYLIKYFVHLHTYIIVEIIKPFLSQFLDHRYYTELQINDRGCISCSFFPTFQKNIHIFFLTIAMIFLHDHSLYYYPNFEQTHSLNLSFFCIKFASMCPWQSKLTYIRLLNYLIFVTLSFQRWVICSIIFKFGCQLIFFNW